MADSLGELVISLRAETATFRSELEKAAATSQGTAKEILGHLSTLDAGFTKAVEGVKALGEVVAVGFGGEKIVEWSKQVIESAASLTQLRSETGSSVEELSRLQNIAEFTGTGFDELRTNLERLAAGLAGAEDLNTKTARALQFLGVSARDPAQALQEVADKLAQYADGAGKAALARDLFGKSGVQFLDTLKDMADAQGIVSTRTTEEAEAAEGLLKQLRLLNNEWNTFKDILLQSVVPALANAARGFNIARQEGLGFIDALGLATADPAKLTETISIYTDKVNRLRQTIASMQEQQKNNPNAAFDDAQGLRIQQTTRDLTTAEAALRAFTRARDAAIMANVQGMGDTGDQVSRQTHLGQLPQLGYTGATDNTANKVDEFARALQAANQEVAHAQQALDELGLTESQKTSPAMQKLIDLLGTDQWAKFSAAQQQQIQDAYLDADAIEHTTASLKESQEAATAYANVLDEIAKHQQDHVDSIRQLVEAREDDNAKLQAEIGGIGLTGEALDQYNLGIERELALKQATNPVEAARINQLYDEAAALLHTKDANQAAADAAKKAAQDEQRAFEESAKNIESSLEDALMRSFKKGEDMGQALRDALENMFKTLILRPLLQPISAGLASIFPTGAGIGGGNLGGLGGLSNIGSYLSGGGIFGSGLGADFATSGIGQSLGLSSLAADGLGPAALTSFGSILGAALPVAGIALAAASAFGLFGGGHGPKGGGFASIGSQANLLNTDSDNQRFYTPNDADASIQSILNTVNSSFSQELAALGGKGNATFGLGYDTDPNGNAGNRLSVGAVVNGRTALDLRNVGIGSDIQGELTLAGQRALLAALQASDFPKQVAAILDSVDAATATQDQITNILALGSAIKSLTGLAGKDSIADGLQAVAVQAQGAFGTFMQTANSLRDLMEQYQGTTDQTNALVQASSDYYNSLVQLQAQVQQVKQSIDDMFGGTTRSLTLSTLDKPGQYNYLRTEADSSFLQMQNATDPATIQRLANLINQDLNQAFGLLTPEQQQAMLPQFTAYITQVQTAADEHLQHISQVAQEAAKDTLTELQTLVSDAATKLNTAAGSINTAAGNLADSAHVSIDFTANVPGATEVNVGG